MRWVGIKSRKSASAGWQPRAATDPLLVTYQLHISLTRAQYIVVGKLGCFRFPAGRYLYTGSARRNMPARVQRHLRTADGDNKTLRWHIDYLLACRYAHVTDIKLSAQPECRCNQQVEGKIPVPKFGASDCRNGCGSHLKSIGGCETS